MIEYPFIYLLNSTFKGHRKKQNAKEVEIRQTASLDIDLHHLYAKHFLDVRYHKHFYYKNHVNPFFYPVFGYLCCRRFFLHFYFVFILFLLLNI